MRIMELTLHTEDLCAGTGDVWSPPSELCEYILDEVSGMISELREAGLFGPAAQPASDSPADRLSAFAGRG